MVTESPFVSIIVPNYNHEKYLVQRLESIFNQTYQNFEVILLDDCSNDNSVEILSKFVSHPKVSNFVFNQKNTGNTSIQWNKGISLAKGEFIWIAESDDVCEIDFLEELMIPFLEDDNVVLSYCNSHRMNEKGDITGDWLNYSLALDDQLFLNSFKLEGNSFIKRFLVFKNIIPNASAVVFRKRRAIELGDIDIDDKLKLCGDWLFYIKLITNHKICYNNKLLNKFRYHSGSVIARANNTRNTEFRIDIINKLREKMNEFIFYESPNYFQSIFKLNNKIFREYEYKKALFLIRNNSITRGLFILISVLDIFIEKYKFKTNFKLKLKRLKDKMKYPEHV